jgi:hypothetical protein
MIDFIFKLFCPHRYRHSWLMVNINNEQSVYIKKYKECSRCKKLYENKNFDMQLESVMNSNSNYNPLNRGQLKGEIKWGLIKSINFNYKYIYDYIDLKEYKREIILNELLE